MMRKRRIDKKIHKTWLQDIVVDVSQISYWRNKLFKLKENEELEINTTNHKDLPEYIVSAITKYKLNYKVSKVSSSEAEPWLSEGGMLIFKFWAVNYPSLCGYSGNNPESI